jgi:hypothetical protein
MKNSAEAELDDGETFERHAESGRGNKRIQGTAQVFR